MTAQTLRLYKEARSLWWPWLLLNTVGILGAITAAPNHPWRQVNAFTRLWYDLAIPIGSFLGIPLIATMVFGLEFQHRTVSLLLSQPIDRMQLWKEKMFVMVAAVLPPTVIYCIGWSIFAPHFDRNNPVAISGQPVPWVVAALAVVVATAAAPYWTMVARTTIGSLVLNGMFPYWTILCLVTLYDRVPSSHAYWPVIGWVTLAMLFVYAAVMLWLGRRKLASYQVTGAAGTDILIETPIPLPRFVQEAFRCRPADAVLNLVRKECRLLRPVWAMALISAITWVLIVAFDLLPLGANEPARHAQPTTNSQVIILALAMVMNLLIAILSGAVSLGEERSSGTHAWHMTLPVSARTQWIVKLLVGVSASIIFGGLMPLGILVLRGFVSGDVWLFAHPEMFWVWPLGLAMVTLLTFWSATVVSGTLRAALWLFPISWSLGIAYWLGASTAEEFGMSMTGWLVSHVDPFHFGRSLSAMFNFLDRHGVTFVPPDPRLILTPLFLVLFVQSYFLFRTQPGESKMRILRALIPGGILLYLTAFLMVMPFFMAASTYSQGDRILRETHEALEQWQAHGAALTADRAAQFAGADLAKEPGVSDRTARWLSDADVTLGPLTAPEDVHVRDFYIYVKSAPDSARPAYAATVRLRNGDSCVIRYQQYPLHANLALSSSFPNHGSVWAHCN